MLTLVENRIGIVIYEAKKIGHVENANICLEKIS